MAGEDHINMFLDFYQELIVNIYGLLICDSVGFPLDFPGISSGRTESL